jgi:hypothetical protein
VYARRAPQRQHGVTRRTPVYVVCSPRARVGKTLTSRLLVDFFRNESRPFAAFDLNRNEPSLTDYLPDDAIPADISDTRGQMALFDRLIVDDGIAKIVDVGSDAFDAFFALIQQIGFAIDARRRFVQPIILFAMNADRSSTRAFARLQRRFTDIPVIPIHNEAMIAGYRIDETRPAAQPLCIPLLPPVLKAAVEKPTFSFVNFSSKRAELPSLHQAWLKQVFIGFRELELRLLLHELSLQFRG